jgi:hypothetical protein
VPRRFYGAMAVYAALAIVAGLDLGHASFHVNGRLVEVRLMVWIVLAGFALRTWIHALRPRE